MTSLVHRIVIDGYSCVVESVKSGDSAVSMLEALCVGDDMAIGENSGVLLVASPMVSEGAGRKNFEKFGYRLWSGSLEYRHVLVFCRNALSFPKDE